SGVRDAPHLCRWPARAHGGGDHALPGGRRAAPQAAERPVAGGGATARRRPHGDLPAGRHHRRIGAGQAARPRARRRAADRRGGATRGAGRRAAAAPAERRRRAPRAAGGPQAGDARSGLPAPGEPAGLARGRVALGMLEYYDRRAPEYDEWYLGTGLFGTPERTGWLAALRPLSALTTAVTH